MQDPNMNDFYNRVARIQRDHSRGFGMEAQGTLGRSAYRLTSKRRIPILAPLILVLMCGVGMKAMLHARIGDGIYQERLAELNAGAGFDRLGAVLMVADPVTLAVSAKLTQFGF
jgi:hypothetical protein